MSEHIVLVLFAPWGFAIAVCTSRSPSHSLICTVVPAPRKIWRYLSAPSEGPYRRNPPAQQILAAKIPANMPVLIIIVIMNCFGGG